MIKILLIGILVFLLIRMILQGFLSYYAGYYEERSSPRENKRKEGEVTIEKRPKLEKRISKDDGQYVDYEEIK